MPKILRSALVNHSRQQMFDLVYEVDKYSEFLPWCACGQILSEDADSVAAKIDIDYKNLKQSFSTKNSIKRHDSINMELVEGPFKFLHGKWNFIKLGENQTKVELSIDFEFKGFLLSKLAGPVFEQIAGSMVDAFVKRATQVYD